MASRGKSHQPIGFKSNGTMNYIFCDKFQTHDLQIISQLKVESLETCTPIEVFEHVSIP